MVYGLEIGRVAQFLHINFNRQIIAGFKGGGKDMNNNKKNKIKGAAMTEYVLIVGLIAAGAILGLTSVGTNIATFFTSLGTTITSASSNL